MRTTGEIIRNKREKADITSERLGEMIGVSQPYVTMIENDKRNPSKNFLTKVKEILKLSEKDMKEIEEYEKIRRIPEELQEKLIEFKRIEGNLFKEVPVYGKASAGVGYLNLETHIYKKRVYLNGYSHNSFLIEICGDSMEPLIEEGSWALVDPCQTEYIKGKIYVVTFNDETFIKQIEKFDDEGIIILRSLNPKYQDILIKENRWGEVIIKGRVVKTLKEETL